MNKKNALFSFFVLLSATLFSQGFVESPLSGNGILMQKHEQMRASGSLRSGGSISDTLSLGANGFLDDFSSEGPYPDTTMWLDNNVFINRDMPIAPITLGVATFDGLNSAGYPYNFAVGMFSSGKADTLTSKPIDLDLPGDTSVYFSFYYQPQGRGNYPDALDSLVLEFKNTAVFSDQWKHVWAVKGPGAALGDSAWTYIKIKITDPGFLRKGFQFRFTNWATLSGNGDHWHIDYVYLNKNRAGESANNIGDVAFVYNTPPLINGYTAVPWKQYTSSMMRTGYNTSIRNNNDSVKYGEFEYKIFDENNIQVNTTYTGGALNLNPYIPTGYVNEPGCASPALNYTIASPLAGKTKYTIQCMIDTVTASNRMLHSDTIRHTQNFDNYFAYDDGTAEVSWGLQGYLHAQIAEKFALNVGDTLRCIDIYFNPQWTNASLYTFKLKVWAVTGSGGPGTTLYSSVDPYTVEYTQGGPNLFTRYYLDAPYYIASGTNFFIGIEQNTAQLVNIGVDKNTNAQGQTYYNTSGTWAHPPVLGSLMMRPIFGSTADVAGIEEGNNNAYNSKVIVYPNPANEQLFVHDPSGNSTDKMEFTINDIFGRTIAEGLQSVSAPIDLTDVSNGVYFIRINSNNNISTSKFIISK